MKASLHPFAKACLLAGLEHAGLPPVGYKIGPRTIARIDVDAHLFLDRAGELLNGHSVEETAKQFWEVRNEPFISLSNKNPLAIIAIGFGKCHLYLDSDGTVRNT